MSNSTNRNTAAPGCGSVEQRLARLLDSPFLGQIVPHLPPETLHQLVRARGLDACSELVTSATPAQLTSVLDLDLWRHARPGRDEQFDVDRFGEWLEVLVDAGHSIAARTVAALDKDLVVLGLCRYVRVFDLGIFEPIAQSDDEPIAREEAMREGDWIEADQTKHPDTDRLLECELAGYVVRPRRAEAWDAIVALLVTLDAEQRHYFQAVMQGCRRLSNSRPEIDGLDDRLLAPEQHLHEVTVERERRRSQQGYLPPADARAFLEMARQPEHTRSAATAVSGNPIVAAYFRAANETAESSAGMAGAAEPRRQPPSPRLPIGSRPAPSAASRASDDHARTADIPASLDAVMELLTEAGAMPPRPRGLIEAADAAPQAARLTRLRRLMAYLRDTHETAFFARSRELAFLANTLLAGCSIQSRSFTAQEAADAAGAICNLGLEYWPAGWSSVSAPGTSPLGCPGTAAPGETLLPESWLIHHDLVAAFNVGWSVLYRDVSLFAADQLIETLNSVHSVDRDLRRGLAALRHTLMVQRQAGTPWRARGAAEILMLLDVTVWISVVGLLDECPVVPAALMATLEGRTSSVSATAFEFISTAKQIGTVGIFMRKLPELLSR